MRPTRRAALAGLLAAATPAAALNLDDDAQLVEAAFRALHPGLARYATPQDLARRFAALRRDLATASTPGATWLALTTFTAAVRCGHTFVNPANQLGAGRAFLEAGRTRLPFAYRWLEGRMIVSAAHGVTGLQPGDEVLALGPTPVRPLRARLMALAAADGHNDAKRARLAELDDSEAWPLPDVALPLLAPAAFARDTVRLRVRRAGTDLDVTAPLLGRAERVAARASRRPSSAGDVVWTAAVEASGVRVLTMPTWALYDSPWDWRAWLDAQVDAAIESGAPGIVLDLRGNAGGQDCGDHLLSRLIARDVVPPDARRFVRYRRTPGELDPYLDTWDRSFRNWGADAIGPDARGLYRLTRWDGPDGSGAIRPRGRRFPGRLVAIIDATNSSATFQFAQTVKAARLGLLVGEPTGGNRRGINGGAFFFLRLPRSGFEVDLPLVATFPAQPQPDAGVLPDLAVATTIADVARVRDPQRDAAVRLAASPTPEPSPES